MGTKRGTIPYSLLSKLSNNNSNNGELIFGRGYIIYDCLAHSGFSLHKVRKKPYDLFSRVLAIGKKNWRERGNYTSDKSWLISNLD